MLVSPPHSISVLIPTYNRAATLELTLQALSLLERDGIDCEFVIIDNNSNDRTAEVVAQYAKSLPLVYLFEARPGKNPALNAALRRPLRDLIVFTDDDTTPDRNWLKQIVAASNNWPEVQVFGGRVEIAWPNSKTPSGIVAPWLLAMGFSEHQIAPEAEYYVPPACPFGPNYWVRRSVFNYVPQFDETIGPHPSNRVMGSETSFLIKLQMQNIRMLYVPSVSVQHRVQPNECTIPALRRRGFTFGRGQTRLHGPYRLSLYQRNAHLWRTRFLIAKILAYLSLLTGYLAPVARLRSELTVLAKIKLGHLHESVQMLQQHNVAPNASLPGKAAAMSFDPGEYEGEEEQKVT
jgi:glycosyltransferase involved in cell wall biosynthesis